MAAGYIKFDPAAGLHSKLAKILLVEDDSATSLVVAQTLTTSNHMVDAVSTGTDGLTWSKTYKYDLMIFDWNLPGLSGIDLMKEVRQRNDHTPVLMLTANAGISHKVNGFNSGADDYLTKPFHIKELELRVNALLKRSERKPRPDTIRGITIVAESFSVIRNGETIQLTAREWKLLEFLIRRPDQFFDSTALLNRVWESDSEATDEALRTCVKRLRQKIDVPGEPSLIKSARGLGYQIESQHAAEPDK